MSPITILLAIIVMITVPLLVSSSKNQQLFNNSKDIPPAPASSPELGTDNNSQNKITDQNLPNSNTSSKEYIYPNSNLITSTDSLYIYESTDNPSDITNWYQRKIAAAGYKISSTVQTNTNGNILNKLVGNDKGKEIRVEISKDNNQSKTIITLNI